MKTIRESSLITQHRNCQWRIWCGSPLNLFNDTDNENEIGWYPPIQHQQHFTQLSGLWCYPDLCSYVVWCKCGNELALRLDGNAAENDVTIKATPAAKNLSIFTRMLNAGPCSHSPSSSKQMLLEQWLHSWLASFIYFLKAPVANRMMLLFLHIQVCHNSFLPQLGEEQHGARCFPGLQRSHIW